MNGADAEPAMETEPVLRTDYLGLHLKSPLVAAASALGESLDNILRLEDAGAAAIVLPSIFEEQILLESAALERDLTRGTESFAESLDYFPGTPSLHQEMEHYLNLIRAAKNRCEIPILASLNGATPGGWVQFAQAIEQAGADALELNTYALATGFLKTSAIIEDGLVDLVHRVRQSVRLRLAVKLSPYYTSIPHLARQLDEAGADALVLFNRFYQPDFDIEQLAVQPRLTLSRPEELLLRLHWVAILYGHLRAELAVTGGVHGVEDVLKSIMAGAQVVQLASALLRHGVGHIDTLHSGLLRWMREHEYSSIRQMRGSLSRRSAPDPSAFERGNYIRTLSSYTLRYKNLQQY